MRPRGWIRQEPLKGQLLGALPRKRCKEIKRLEETAKPCLSTLTENCSSFVCPARKASVCRNHLKRRKGISQPRGSTGFYDEILLRVCGEREETATLE